MHNDFDPRALTESEILDIERSLANLNGDAEFLGQLLALFSEDGPMRLDEAEAALRLGDQSAALHSAHSLKGISGTIGAPALMQLSVAAENLAREQRLDEYERLLPALRQTLDLVLERIRRFQQKQT